jgi:hypothetical protein
MSNTPSDANGKKYTDKDGTGAFDGASITLRGSVDRIVQAPNGSDEAEIVIEGGENLYREIRIQNLLQGANGDVAVLQLGSEVEITIKARKTARRA